MSPVAPVPVGGGVMVEVDCLYGADSKLAAARLRCGISRGTFPHVSWLLNASVLPSETSTGSHIQPLLKNYALADSGRSLFVTSLGPEESGFYRCRARDSYDDSRPWVESQDVLVQVTGDAMNCKMFLKKEIFFKKLPNSSFNHPSVRSSGVESGGQQLKLGLLLVTLIHALFMFPPSFL